MAASDTEKLLRALESDSTRNVEMGGKRHGLWIRAERVDLIIESLRRIAELEAEVEEMSECRDCGHKRRAHAYASDTATERTGPCVVAGCGCGSYATHADRPELPDDVEPLSEEARVGLRWLLERVGLKATADAYEATLQAAGARVEELERQQEAHLAKTIRDLPEWKRMEAELSRLEALADHERQRRQEAEELREYWRNETKRIDAKLAEQIERRQEAERAVELLREVGCRECGRPALAPDGDCYGCELREARGLLERWSDILVFRSHGYMLDPLCGVQERTDLASDTRTYLDAGSDDDGS